jgi:hypothetical protein
MGPRCRVRRPERALRAEADGPDTAAGLVRSLVSLGAVSLVGHDPWFFSHSLSGRFYADNPPCQGRRFARPLRGACGGLDKPDSRQLWRLRGDGRRLPWERRSGVRPAPWRSRSTPGGRRGGGSVRLLCRECARGGRRGRWTATAALSAPMTATVTRARAETPRSSAGSWPNADTVHVLGAQTDRKSALGACRRIERGLSGCVGSTGEGTRPQGIVLPFPHRRQRCRELSLSRIAQQPRSGGAKRRP